MSEILQNLTDEQRAAVTHLEGPAYVTSSPGSGKTRCVTRRIAYLIDQGVQPYKIIAVTFTNKAANEMRERVAKLVPKEKAKQVKLSTFHSFGARLLRQNPQDFDVNPNYNITDETDAKEYVVRAIARVLDRDPKLVRKQKDGYYSPRFVQRRISLFKGAMVLPNKVTADRDDRVASFLRRAYREYRALMISEGQLDFDDLIMLPVLGFRNKPALVERYSRSLDFLLVDEFQDTDSTQEELIEVLGKTHHNVYVVGDGDQAIYGWRRADSANEERFFRFFGNTQVYRLQYNFRSVPGITKLANTLIKRNERKIEKEIIPVKKGGAIPRCIHCADDYQQAHLIINQIVGHVKQDGSWADHAIIYRTKAQSRALEEAAVSHKVPYRVIGTLSFYNRAVIKDALAYLRVLTNPEDNVAFTRLHNTPARRFGDVAFAAFCRVAEAQQLSFYPLLKKGGYEKELGPGGLTATGQLRNCFQQLEKLHSPEVGLLLDKIVEWSGYRRYLQDKREDAAAQNKLEMLDELITAGRSFDAETGEGPLAFLQHVTLVQGSSTKDDQEKNVVLMMTGHAAKGLEFPHVYLPGLVDGLFPLNPRSDDGAPITPKEVQTHYEEERRVFFVACTRAEETLTIYRPLQQRTRTDIRRTAPSRFLREVGDTLQHIGEDKLAQHSPALQLPQRRRKRRRR